MDKLEFVSLKQVNEKIIEIIRGWRNLKEIRKYMYNNHYISKQEHKEWAKKTKSSDEIKFWIVYYKSNPIGSSYLKDIDYQNKITDWGFYIGEKDYRGQGIGKSMLYNLMIFTFNKLELRKMYTKVLSNNEVALNLYQDFGFKKEGCLRKHLIRDNEFKNIILMGILKDEWSNIKKKLKDRYNLFKAEFK